MQILVLGMHRSGTSMVARLLNMAGAHAGVEGDLTDTGIGRENPKGFWERRDVRSANEALLASQACSWDCVSAWAPGQVPEDAVERFRREAGLIALKLDMNRPWVAKDPRLSLTVAHWCAVLELPRLVLCLRDPREVALSLQVRNAFPIELGLALWEAYTLHALHGAGSLQCHVVAHAELIADPLDCVSRLVANLQLDGVHGLRVPAQHEIAAFMDPALYRSRVDSSNADHPAVRLFQLLEAHHADEAVGLRLSDESLEALRRHERLRALIAAEVARPSPRSGPAAALPVQKLLDDLEAVTSVVQALQTDIDARASAMAGAQAALSGEMGARLEALRSMIREGERRMNDLMERTLSELEALRSEREATSTVREELAVAIEEANRTRILLDEERSVAMELADRQRRAERALEDVETVLSEASRLVDICMRAAAATRASWRWRLGDRAVRVAEAILRRRGGGLAFDELERRLEILKRALRRRPVPAPPASRSAPPPCRPAAVAAPKTKTAVPARIPSTPARCVVYTAIAGDYDRLMQPEIVSPDCDYVVLTDSVGEPDPDGIWQYARMDYVNADPTRSARFAKLHPHLYFPQYEYSIWIDGNLLLRGDPSELLDRCGEAPIAAFIHPHRACVYEEAEEILQRGGLDAPEVVKAHVEMLRAAGYPAGQGLTETNVLVRRHNDSGLIAFHNEWWRLIDNGSRRDQLSVNIAAWKSGVTIAALAPKGVSVRNHPMFQRFLHGEKSTYVPRRNAVETPLRLARLHTSLPVPADLDVITTDVIICVHNAAADVDRCLQSVVPTLSACDRIIVIDDGSDQETRQVIARHASHCDRIVVLRHEHASGYTKAANAGIRASSAEFLIFLNSDTIVPSGWIERLKRAAYASPHIGLVGPLSNAASWQSVPRTLGDDGRLAVNHLPDGVGAGAADLICQAISQPPTSVLVALLNGFCLGVKRKVIDSIGQFDEQSFPRGYGEENDFCFRASDAGWLLAVATDCYVFHAKSKSYSPEGRDLLAAEGSKAFRAKYPDRRIANAIQSTRDNPLLEAARERFAEALRARESSIGANVQAERRILPSMPLPDEPGGPEHYDLSTQQLRDNMAVCNGNWPFLATPPGSMLWFVPQFEHVLRGGIRTIFSLAEDFSRAWGTRHWFVVYGRSVVAPVLARKIRDVFPHLRFDVIAIDRPTDAADLPEADAGVCTLWNSAYHLAKYNRCKAKLYLAQDFEPSFYRAGTTYAMIEQTYSLGFNVLANSSGVADRVRELTNRVDHFDPGVDASAFHPDPALASRPGPRRIVFYGRPRNPRNAFELGIAALKIVKERLGSAVEIVSVGGDFDADEYGCSGVIENRGVLGSMEDVADLYRSARVGLVFMYSAHPSYQPLEYMASGCVTVTNENPSNRWLLRDGENCLLARSLPADIADRIVRVLEDDELFEKLRTQALEDVRELTWERAFRQARDAILNPAR